MTEDVLKDFQIEGRDDAERQQLKQLLADTLAEAENSGLKVEVEPANDYYARAIAVHGDSQIEKDAFQKRVDCIRLSEPIHADEIAGLIRFYQTWQFLVGVELLKDRITKLGWYSNLEKHAWRLHIGNRNYIDYDMTPEELIEVRRYVECSELSRQLLAQNKVIEEAGIIVKIHGDTMDIILAENDPVLRRRLTAKNVQWLIDVAKLMSECHCGCSCRNGSKAE